MIEEAVNLVQKGMEKLNLAEPEKKTESEATESPAVADKSEAKTSTENAETAKEAATSAKSETTSSGEATEKSEDSSEKSEQLPRSLFVSELDPDVNEAILFEVFSDVAPIASIRVCRDASTRESLRYAYVNFHNHEDAKAALERLNYTPVYGRPCRIMWSQRDPSMRRKGKGNVFFKNLEPELTDKDLHEALESYGEILSCKVVTNSNGDSLGYGFVHFADPKAAQAAINELNGQDFNGRIIYAALHQTRNERVSRAAENEKQFTNCYVKNFDLTTTEEQLKAAFEPFGEITSLVIEKDNEGKSRGFGFVNYNTHEAAQKAVDEMNGKELNLSGEGSEKQKLFVSRAQSKFERQIELRKSHNQVRSDNLNRYQGVNLYVKNLDEDVSSDDLKEMFEPFGTITSARVMRDDNGKSRGFGFVCYTTSEEATRAISEMHQHVVGSRPLYVAHAQRKDARSNQMRQQLQQHNQMRYQQQHFAMGMMGQFMPGQQPIMYPGGPDDQFSNAFGQGVVPAPGQWRPEDHQAGQTAQAGQQESQQETQQSSEELLSHEKQAIGEQLYVKITDLPRINGNQDLALQITGMLLEANNDVLLMLLNEPETLDAQVEAAITAYEEHKEATGSA